MRILAGVALVIVLLAWALPAEAQTTISGSVAGTIKDDKGAPLTGVTVIVSSNALVSGQASSVTDANGVYRFPSLPPGTYTIEAQLAGYNPVRQERLRIWAAKSLVVNMTLPLVEVTEEVTVTAAAPTISISENTVSTKFDLDYIEMQPIPRNYYQVIGTAPGVNMAYTASSGSAMLAYGGTSEGQNAYTIDGVNVADAGAGQHWVLPAIQWMQEIQVGGLGANAEYGGYTGGIINAVTKSGGNEFRGEVEYYYQPESWSSDNDPDPDSREEYKFSDLAVSFGGPIIKDKLWYFVSGEYWKQTSTSFKAVESSERTIPRFLGKLTWQPSDKNRFTFVGEWDGVKHERRGVSRYTLPEASSKQDAPGVSFALHWDSYLSSDYFLNMKLTGYDGRDDYFPYNGFDTPGRIDEDTGYAWVNQDIREINHRHVVTLDSSLSVFKQDLFGKNDSHTFKIGLTYEDASSSDQWLRNGGFTYYDWSGDCESLGAYFDDPTCGPYYVERGWGEYDEALTYQGLAFYAQDTLRIGRVTLNPGLRFGTYKAGWQNGNDNVYDVNYLDPRFGVIWDVRGDAHSAIKFHWGRYHEKFYTYMIDRERSGKAVIPDQDCYWNYDTLAYDDCDEPTLIQAKMGNTDEHPYVDESVLTFEQQLGTNHVLGLDLIDRRFRHIMAMINTNNDYKLVTKLDNPYGGKFPVYALLSPPEFVLTTDNGAYRDFQSVVLRYEKRLANSWSLRSSLVWTDLDGNIAKNNGYADEWRDKNGFYNNDGNMDYAFSEWEYKLTASYLLPKGFEVGGNYTYLSGWYWTPYGRVRDLGDYGYNASIGRDINLVPRGSEQFPDRHLLDLRVAWTTKLPRGMSLTTSLEAFNVLDKDTVLDIYDRFGNCYIEDGRCFKASNFEDEYQLETPRQLRAGVRWSF